MISKKNLFSKYCAQSRNIKEMLEYENTDEIFEFKIEPDWEIHETRHSIFKGINDVIYLKKFTFAIFYQ